MHTKTAAVLGTCLFIAGLPAHPMGLRSFVALPVDKGGAVLRTQFERAMDANTDELVVNLAYGLSATRTILLGLPYRLSPAGTDRLGDLGILYRHTVWQHDFRQGTHRVGLLGGLVAPTQDDRDGAVQVGVVATRYEGRHEWDIDGLYQVGLGDRRDGFRYDLSWQYRLSPARRPTWGTGSEVDAVVELGGRWTAGSEIIHQATFGLQWIHPRWVLEGGVFRDLTGPEDTHVVLSSRFHF